MSTPRSIAVWTAWVLVSLWTAFYGVEVATKHSHSLEALLSTLDGIPDVFPEANVTNMKTYFAHYLGRYYTSAMDLSGLRIHGISMVVVSLAALLQFVPVVRTRWPAVHRQLGRVYVYGYIIAFLTSLTLLWNTKFGPFMKVASILYGAYGCASAMIGAQLARQRRIGLHREWMIRSYSVVFGALFIRSPLSTVFWFVLTGLYDIAEVSNDPVVFARQSMDNFYFFWAFWTMAGEFYLAVERTYFQNSAPKQVSVETTAAAKAKVQ